MNFCNSALLMIFPLKMTLLIDAKVTHIKSARRPHSKDTQVLNFLKRSNDMKEGEEKVPNSVEETFEVMPEPSSEVLQYRFTSDMLKCPKNDPNTNYMDPTRKILLCPSLEKSARGTRVHSM